MKLTREEAVEMLKNRKVHVKDAQESEVVQRKLFECGFRWRDGTKKVILTKMSYLCIEQDMHFAYYTGSLRYDIAKQTEISVEEIKAIEIVDKPEEQQKLNLCEILKDCPKGMRFYCSLYGYVTLEEVNSDDKYPIRFKVKSNFVDRVTQKGFLYEGYEEGECVFFPSKEQRDWSKWVCPKPDLPVDTPMMVSSDKKDWWLRYYAGDKKCWKSACKSKDIGIRIQWNHIIPFDKFNPNDIEESLKYDICKK